MQIAEREREYALAGYSMTGKAKDVRTKETRDAKPENGVDMHAWLEDVRAVMAEHGLDNDAVDALHGARRRTGC